MTYMAAWINFNLENWSEAIEGFEKSLEMLRRFDAHPWSWTYILLGRAYHFAGQHKKEEKTFETGREHWPDQYATFAYWQAICALSLEDSVRAQVYLDEIGAMIEQKGWPEAIQYTWFAGIYTWTESWGRAEEYYRKAVELRAGRSGGGECSCLDLMPELICLGRRRHAQFLCQQFTATFILGQCCAALVLQHIQAHQLPVR